MDYNLDMKTTVRDFWMDLSMFLFDGLLLGNTFFGKGNIALVRAQDG
jgi:hypothetical protein